jgi:hypothetical protein
MTKPKMQANVYKGYSTGDDGERVATFNGPNAATHADKYVAALRADGDIEHYVIDVHDRAKRLTVYIEHDSDCRAPDRDCDGQWKLYSFSSRHDHYGDPEKLGLTGEWGADDGPEFTDDETGRELKRKLDVGLAFYLSYYEHGNCLWEITHEPRRKKGVEFDRVSLAGLLVWEHEDSDMGPTEKDAREKDAKGFLETFTAWCNGETYEYHAEDETGEELEDVKCSGFYGSELDYMFSRIREELDKDAEVTFAGDHADLAEYHDKPTKDALAAKAEKKRRAKA